MVEIRNIIAAQKPEGQKDFGVNLNTLFGTPIIIKAVEFGENDQGFEYATVTLADGTRTYTFSGVLIKQLHLCEEYLARGEVVTGVITRPRGKDYYTFQ